MSKRYAGGLISSTQASANGIFGPQSFLQGTIGGSLGGGSLISTITFTDSNNTTLTANAAATVGNSNITITGSGFANNANLYINGSKVSNVIFVNSSTVRANVANLSQGNYNIMLMNPSGSGAIYYSGIDYQPYPLWTVSGYSNYSLSVSVQLQSTSYSGTTPMVFSLASGSSLPSGLSLSSSGGLTGTTTVGVYTFDVNVTNSYNQVTRQTISLNVQTSDPYFPATVLFLNANTTTLITDTSTNNLNLTPNVTNSMQTVSYPSPYYGALGSGYYSYSFTSATSDSLTASSFSAIGTGNFSIEAFVYPIGGGAICGTFVQLASPGDHGIQFYHSSGSNNFTFFHKVDNSTQIGISTPGSYPINNWYHVVACRTGTTLSLFVNGTRQATTTYSSSIAETSMAIGRISTTGYGSNYYTGYINNFRFNQANSLYDATQTTLTVPTGPLIATPNTRVLTCSDYLVIDRGSLGSTMTISKASGNVKVAKVWPTSFSNTANSVASTVYFNGTTDFINIPANTALSFGTGNFTMECFISPRAYGAREIIDLFSNASGSYITGQCQLQLNSTGTISFTYATGVSTTSSVTSTIAVPLNAWSHVAVVRISSALTLYINGMNAATASVSQALGTSGLGSIGRQTNSLSNFFSGFMSNVRIVNGTGVYTSAFTPPTSALTAVANTSLLTLSSTITSNSIVGFNNKSVSDGGNNYSTIISSAGDIGTGTFTPFSRNGWSTNFTGTSNYFSIGDTASIQIGTKPFCIEAWIYPTSLSTNFWIAQKRLSNGGASGTFTFYITGGTGNVAFTEVATVNSFAFSSNGAVVTANNSWYHVAAVRDYNNVFNLFVNGTVVYSRSSFTTNLNYNTTMYIGHNLDVSGLSAGGYISNFRLTNGSTPYATNTSFIPSTTALTPEANTVLLTCNSAYTKDTSNNNLAVGFSSATSNSRILSFSPFAPGQPYSVANNGVSLFGVYKDVRTQSGSYLAIGDFTFQGWYYVNDFSGGNISFFTISHAGGDFAGRIVVWWGSGGTSLNVFGNGDLATWATTIPLRRWVYVTLTRSGGTMTLYYNGVSAGSASTNGAGNTFAPSRSDGIFVTTMNGWACDLQFYDRYLGVPTAATIPTTPFQSNTINEVKTFFNGPVPTLPAVIDQSDKNDIITFGNTRVSNTIKKYGVGSIAFSNTSSDYLLVSPTQNLILGTLDFTIEMWLYLTTIPTVSSFLFDTRPASTNGVYPALYVYSDGTLNWYVSSLNLITSSALSTGTWYHIAVCRANGTTRMFINGTQTGSSYVDSNSYLTNNNILIGASYNGGASITSFLNGYIQDYRLTRSARYTTTFSVPADLNISF